MREVGSESDDVSAKNPEFPAAGNAGMARGAPVRRRKAAWMQRSPAAGLPDRLVGSRWPCQPVPGRVRPPSEAPRPTARGGLLVGARVGPSGRALAEIGPRVTGTRGASRARQYLRAQLEEIGATVSEVRVPRRAGRVPVGRRGGARRCAATRVTRPIGSCWPRHTTHRSSRTSSSSVRTRAHRGLPWFSSWRARSRGSPRPYTLMVVLLDGDFVPTGGTAGRTRRAYLRGQSRAGAGSSTRTRHARQLSAWLPSSSRWGTRISRSRAICGATRSIATPSSSCGRSSGTNARFARTHRWSHRPGAIRRSSRPGCRASS